ncbi:MAG: hypothetical protein KDJ65_32570 [Anaerolineae bacterium]|nr:hypothetical protein [Anaerolineae bacterium]
MGNNQPQSNRGIQNRCVGNRGTATIEKKGDSQHYLPGEKEKYKYGILSLEMPSPSPLFDAIAYGFAPGSSEIHMDYWATSKEFKPLIDEIIKPVEQVPFGKKLRTVAVIGCTDKVKSSTKPYDDQKLRLKRAEEFKELIEKLLPYKYRNKIRIIAKPLPEEADESLKPADTSVARERSRAVGIKLIQTGSCNRLTPEHVFDYYSSLLKKKNCSSKLSKVDYLFITDAIKIVRSGGDGKYITVDLTKNAISTYFKYFNKIYKAIESGSETEKRKLGKANGIPYPCTTFVCTTASKVKWYTQMTEKRLKKEKPSLFKLPYKTELLEHKLA